MSTAIYQAIKAQGKTVIGLAKECGVSRSLVYQAIDGGGSRKMRVRLALMAEKPPTTLWGHVYQYELDDLFYEKKAERGGL